MQPAAHPRLVTATLLVAMLSALALLIPARTAWAGETRGEGTAVVQEIGKDVKFFFVTFKAGKIPPEVKGRKMPLVLAPKTVIVKDDVGKPTDLLPDKLVILLGKFAGHPEIPEKITPDDVLRGTLKQLKKGSFTATMIIFGPTGLPPGYDAKTASRTGDDLMFARIKSLENGIEVAPVTDETKPYVVTVAPDTPVLLTSQVAATDVKPDSGVYTFGVFRNKDAKTEEFLPEPVVFEAQMFRLLNRAFTGERYESIVKYGLGM